MSPLTVLTMDLWSTVKSYEISLVMDEIASDTDTGDESEGAAAVGKNTVRATVIQAGQSTTFNLSGLAENAGYFNEYKI